MHFDFQLRIWIKTNVFVYVLIDIIFQLQTNDQWHSIVFDSKKMISAKRNYETHDQKLLIIIDNFKHWKHYLKNSLKFVEILVDHNNLKKFMNVQMLNERQTRWIMKLIFFDFIINHRSKKINFVDASLKRFDYYDEKNIRLHKLLSILQKKIADDRNISRRFNVEMSRYLCFNKIQREFIIQRRK